MIPARYVLLAWSSASLVPWLAVWVARPRLRAPMLWSSVFALPFGLSELMFAGSYWAPPTLFDLARRVHVDLESFVFLFASGGLAGVAYNAATGRPVDVAGRAPKRRDRKDLHDAALATPALVFAAGLLVLHAPIEAGIAAMAAGAAARVAVRPDLAVKTCVGGLLFFAWYVALLASLAALVPGYLAAFWLVKGPLATTVAGLPVSELLYGATFGIYWSGLHEHYRWTFRRA